jgi:uncharacterized protein YcbK (DUF882 family)
MITKVFQAGWQSVSHDSDRRIRRAIQRRDFLRGAGFAALGLAPLGAACARVIGAAAEPSQRRSLSFVHTHTGETLSAVYFEGGAYRPSSLERVNHLLRDFRTNDVHPIDPRVLDILFDLQVLANRDEPFQVISGYRAPATNATLRKSSSGVAEHSLHMQGQAIDVRLGGFPTRKLRELAFTLQRGGVGFYPKSDFVHIDSGRVRFW